MRYTSFVCVQGSWHYVRNRLQWFHVCYLHSSGSAQPTSSLKGGRVMIAFFVNYSTIAFPLHLPTLKRQQFFGAVANSLGKKFIFPATVGRAALCGANR